MGATRMNDNPKMGVVDRNCKVHGIANLYVAGASCYPTSGAPNPTLTLTALTLRLSDHIKQSFKI
jgi:choline dehydrogenase-like flavoprotein